MLESIYVVMGKGKGSSPAATCAGGFVSEPELEVFDVATSAHAMAVAAGKAEASACELGLLVPAPVLSPPSVSGAAPCAPSFRDVNSNILNHELTVAAATSYCSGKRGGVPTTAASRQ